MSSEIILVSLLVFVTVDAFPEHFACSRKIKIGEPIMAAEFQGGSIAASIQIDKVACGGLIQTNTEYAPLISGVPMNPFLSGESVRPCIADRAAGLPLPNFIYLIDVTDKDHNPFPGAQFMQGAHVWDGTGTLSGPKVCPARSTGYKSIPSPPFATITPPILSFAHPGKVTIRLAWSHGPFDGVFVVENCTYTVIQPFCAAPKVCLDPGMSNVTTQAPQGGELVLMLRIDFSHERWAVTSNPHPDLLKFLHKRALVDPSVTACPALCESARGCAVCGHWIKYTYRAAKGAAGRNTLLVFEYGVAGSRAGHRAHVHVRIGK